MHKQRDTKGVRGGGTFIKAGAREIQHTSHRHRYPRMRTARVIVVAVCVCMYVCVTTHNCRLILGITKPRPYLAGGQGRRLPPKKFSVFPRMCTLCAHVELTKHKWQQREQSWAAHRRLFPPFSHSKPIPLILS